MNTELTLALLTVALSFAASITGSVLAYRTQANRTPSQNLKDNMEAANLALEISETSTTRNLELAKRIIKLEKILEARHYKVTVTFSLGEKPVVSQATVEAVAES